MRQRRSILFLIGVAALAFGASAWAADMKIGVVEPQKVLEETKSGKMVKAALADYVGVRQKLLDTEADDIKKIEDDLQKQGAVLSAEARQEKEAVLRQKVAVYQRKVQELEGEVQAKKAELLGEFTQKVERAVKEIAEKEKIDLVMEKGSSEDGTLVIFSHPSIDLTSRVIRDLDGRKDN